MARPAVRDDIPVARRTLNPALRRRRGWRPVLGTAVVLLALGVGLVLVFPGPLRRLLGPPPVQGLSARQGIDGRLLGHFPYAEAKAIALVEVAPGQSLRREAAQALRALLQDAAGSGVDLRLLSAFRSEALQKHLFFDVKAARNQSAEERARVSAPPGFSEHSTGYAVDLGDGSRPQTNLSANFDQTPAFHWLKQNANRYHFQLSFPLNNRQGVSYEPWHWRFEGSADALRQFEAAQRFNR
ncbi:D-alanyl-D-alanine carboxypeptidase family protein [Cyanobium sp. Morenito 9A2]|uniref:M15 family metallopeptidase n=1 Tax=Cyanobium sp. Morenito 9A2 TaxID=2823718 RepID=UPI0020CFACC3|nr:M15 family metallopeptidase [Cyanobium sp. Morenito 9A2]